MKEELSALGWFVSMPCVEVSLIERERDDER